MEHQEIKDLLSELKHHADRVNQLKCFIGFDGYVDQIIRIVKERSSLTDYALFQKIEHFSTFLQENTGKSAGLEIISTESKLGGNAPIMANSLARQGVQTICVGTLGEPDIHAVFADLTHVCTTVSVGTPAATYAFEFQDGKIMFGDVASLNQMDWKMLKHKVGLDSIIQYCVDSQLISIVNWSGIFNINTILNGFLEDVFPQIVKQDLAKKLLFFDIADPSTRTEADLLIFIDMLQRFSQQTKVILGLNEKEMRIVFERLGLKSDSSNVMEMTEQIYNRLNISVLVVHAALQVVGVNCSGTIKVDSFYIADPKISTGAGDNFNGGFCLGQMLELSLKHSLILGNAVSSYYISHGYSPNLSQLIDYLEKLCNPVV
ncbi:MAG: PfkB family carbohydrate kinase [Paenibacillaceae bacterium]